MSKQFLAVIIVVILALVGVFALTGSKSDNSKSSASSKAATNHVEGSGKSGVKLVEYGDYQCPFCGQAYPVVKQAVSQFNDQIYFQFRNFPLVSIHQNAFAAARAAEAAGMQNKYWDMHDKLYENQNQWSESSDPTKYFDQYAQQIGLNQTKFQADYKLPAVNDAINADTAAGNKLGVNATPTFYLNGKKIELTPQDPSSVTAFKQQIQNAIDQKTGSKSQ